MVAAERRAHVVLFPFMAQGHLAPFRCLAELARRARPGARVTVVATPGTAGPLRASLAADSLGGDVGVHALPFDPAGYGLPAGACTTAGIVSHQLITLFAASESLRPAFQHLVAGLRAADPGAEVHVMADMFLGWTLDVAREASASHSAVLTTGGYGAAVYFSLWSSVPLPEDDAFLLPPFPDVTVCRSQLTDHLAAGDGTDAWSTFVSKQVAAFAHTDALLVNTAENLEPRGLAMLRQLFNVPIYPVGPLLRATPPAPAQSPGAKDGRAILAWLDKLPPGSVLYVLFGSQYTIGAPQMMELAAGLELSAHRFVWVIRPPAGSDDVSVEFRPEWLPEGFRERAEAGGRGLVARCWAPQVEILAHAATGAFLTHCGWNSLQESLGSGVPLLGWPLSAEQFYNAKVLAEEMEVCVEVARAALSTEKLAAAVEAVLGDTAERAGMRRRAAELREVIAAARESMGEGSSLKVMDKFFADVVHC
ncbi:UDP-glycosyltransferase 92A1-like [Panicum virgatum]|uniref:UDP-glycosyltransferase 92A1-like n=1 Tax=Panicum virgatum TaxID=38727 RepID=UPI0019D63B80|nr:UDP-glycosyltransferase 92A1-like [Panicum virgatum]